MLKVRLFQKTLKIFHHLFSHQGKLSKIICNNICSNMNYFKIIEELEINNTNLKIRIQNSEDENKIIYKILEMEKVNNYI